MNFKLIYALYKKEMKDIFRDKKTLLMMIMIPIILYPLLLVGMVVLLNNIQENNIEKIYRVGFYQVDEKDEIINCMLDESDEYEYNFQIIQVSDVSEALKNKNIDVYIKSEKSKDQINFTLCYISSISDSKMAASMMEDILYKYREQLRVSKVLENNLEVKSMLYPITVEEEDGATKEEAVGSIMGSLIPFLLITTILLGAIYPAIDVTAGEKERGTLETLLTLPVSNVEIILSKFLAVSTIAIVSAVLNMASMSGVCVYFFKLMSFNQTTVANFNMLKFLPAILCMVLCVIAFTMFVSAVCVCICIFAKSFKEAQNYSTPILLIFMLASYIGIIPGVELTSTTAAIPVVNISLMIESVFSFNFDITLILIALFTNIAYGFIAIWIMSKCFNSEGILFGESTGNLKLMEKRINMKPNQMPSLGDVIILFSVILLFMLYFGSYATIRWGLNGVFMQQIGMLLILSLYSWYMKCDVKKVFSFQLPKGKHVLGSILLWFGIYIFMIMVSAILVPLYPNSVIQSNQLISFMKGKNIFMIIIMIAIMPAIGEEIMFRGFLLGSIRRKWKKGIAIIATGLIFGLYHGSILKFFVIGMLGCALAYAVYQSGSILCSMLMHLLNNVAAIIITLYPKEVSNIIPILVKDKLLPVEFIGMFVLSGTLLFIGILLLEDIKLKQNK